MLMKIGKEVWNFLEKLQKRFHVHLRSRSCGEISGPWPLASAIPIVADSAPCTSRAWSADVRHCTPVPGSGRQPLKRRDLATWVRAPIEVMCADVSAQRL